MAAILIVDDEPDVRRILRDLAEHDGHSAIEAGDGHQAVEAAARSAPDLAIVDIIMPEQDGFETIRRLRALCPSIRILVVSGGGKWVGGEYLDMARRLGAEAVLPKPFQLLELRDTIRKVLAEPDIARVRGGRP